MGGLDDHGGPEALDRRRARDRRRRQRQARRDLRRLRPVGGDGRVALFQLVLYPIKASAVVQELWVTTGVNNLYAVQGRAATNLMADKARALFAEDAALTARYHALGGGKWNRMMSHGRGWLRRDQRLRVDRSHALDGADRDRRPPLAGPARPRPDRVRRDRLPGDRLASRGRCVRPRPTCTSTTPRR